MVEQSGKGEGSNNINNLFENQKYEKKDGFQNNKIIIDKQPPPPVQQIPYSRKSFSNILFGLLESAAANNNSVNPPDRRKSIQTPLGLATPASSISCSPYKRSSLAQKDRVFENKENLIP